MRIWAIALNTFSEAARNKVFYLILVFAVLMIFMGAALANISMGQDNRVMIDLGVFASRAFGVLLAMFVGVYLIYDEVERRTLYTIIAHGTKRWEFIVGKYLGLLMTIAVNVVIMCALLMLVLRMWGKPEAGEIPWLTIAWQMSLVVMEMGVVISFAMLFSSFSTPILSAFLTFIVWLIGNATLDILKQVIVLEQYKGMPWLADVLRGVFMPLPHLGEFNVIRYNLDAGKALPFEFFPYLYGFFYSAWIISIAAMIFSRKDIK